ncbi:MAG: hypothetical protein HYV39_02095 [Candidatus Levybacteria bacterium]|nr:hypothetical protein [Candidatus Levybacteria bacterium]
MPSLPTPDQLVARAIVREAMPQPAAPPQGSREAVIKAMNQRVNQSEWRIAAELGKKPAVDRKKTREVIEEIGITRDPTTGAKLRTPGTPEAVRYTNATNAEALAFKFLDNGYNGMTALEQGVLETRILQAARTRPAFAMELNGMTANQQQEWARRRLRDPRFGGEVGKMLQTLSEQGKLGEAITQAEAEVENEDLERRNRQLDIDDVDRRLARTNGQLAEFARPGGGTPMGAKATEIERIKTNITSIQTELTTFQTQVNDANFRLTQLQAERTAALRPGYTGRALFDIDTEISTERTKLTTAQGEADKRQADLLKLPALEQEEQRLEEQKRIQDKEKQGYEVKMNETMLKLTRAQRKLQDARSLRESQEDDIVNGFQSVFTEAANGVLDGEVQTYLDAANAELEKLKQQAADRNPDEKAMYDALQQVWLGAERRRGIFHKESYRPIDRAAVDRDYNLLLTQGPDAVMRRLLITRVNPATGAPYTTAEANAIIADKAYVEKMQPEVVKQLLAKRILSGGVTQEDAQIIVMSQWGRGMIEQALAVKTELRSAIEGLAGAGALGGPGLVERMTREVGRNPWWLLVLLGIIGGPIAGLSALTGAGIGSAAALGGAGMRATSQPLAHDFAA